MNLCSALVGAPRRRCERFKKLGVSNGQIISRLVILIGVLGLNFETTDDIHQEMLKVKGKMENAIHTHVVSLDLHETENRHLKASELGKLK